MSNSSRTRKKRKPRGRPEILTRTIEISSFSVSLRVGVDEPRDPEPEIEVTPWLELRGTLNQPVRETAAVVLSVYPKAGTKVGPARPPAVGSVISVRTAVDVVVSLPHVKFDWLWSFALSGHLKHVWIELTAPRYNRARVLAISFSTEAEE